MGLAAAQGDHVVVDMVVERSEAGTRRIDQAQRAPEILAQDVGPGHGQVHACGVVVAGATPCQLQQFPVQRQCLVHLAVVLGQVSLLHQVGEQLVVVAQGTRVGFVLAQVFAGFLQVAHAAVADGDVQQQGFGVVDVAALAVQALGFQQVADGARLVLQQGMAAAAQAQAIGQQAVVADAPGDRDAGFIGGHHLLGAGLQPAGAAVKEIRFGSCISCHPGPHQPGICVGKLRLGILERPPAEQCAVAQVADQVALRAQVRQLVQS